MPLNNSPGTYHHYDNFYNSPYKSSHYNGFRNHVFRHIPFHNVSNRRSSYEKTSYEKHFPLQLTYQTNQNVQSHFEVVPHYSVHSNNAQFVNQQNSFENRSIDLDWSYPIEEDDEDLKDYGDFDGDSDEDYDEDFDSHDL